MNKEFAALHPGYNDTSALFNVAWMQRSVSRKHERSEFFLYANKNFTLIQNSRQQKIKR